MIFIAAKFKVREEYVDRWPHLVADFTNATRAEHGCLWFEWSRSLDDPAHYVLIEAFRDDEAGVAHVGSEHFKRAIESMPQHLQETPKIINMMVPGEDWSLLGEFTVPTRD
jgi:quinol monooxygenase YgiN